MSSEALPKLLFSDSKGSIYSHPYLRMLGAGVDSPVLPCDKEVITFPKGTTLFYLPGRFPLGFNSYTEKVECLKEFDGEKTWAVGGFLPPAYLRLYNPATKLNSEIKLPLWAYSSVGYKGGKFFIAAAKVDKRRRQSPGFYDDNKVKRKISLFKKKYPKNRLYAHLSYCALGYNCLAAKNLFLERWEAPVPTSQSCNSKCIGCLSLQSDSKIASHQRINFRPSVPEAVEVMCNHLNTAREAIVSFGQGCEGEPLLEADLIEKSVIQVREGVKRGTVNVNTNASLPKQVEKLCFAGVDSFRVSLNSFREKYYNLYFRPCKYRFFDVLKSIEIMKKYNKFVSVNLFVFPGFSDSEAELKAMRKFISKTGVDMIQWRNLNIDPDLYRKKMAVKGQKPLGVLNFMAKIKREFPRVKHGYFNLPKEHF